MLLASLVMASAALAQASVPGSAPIIVTGHAWAPFVSPMGEPYRARSASDDTLADWFGKADANHDSQLTPGELEADADRFFSVLDTNGDGQIDPDELANYEWQIAPEIQAMSRTRRPPGQAASPKASRTASTEASLALDGALQGAARYGLLNIPEPVAAADTNFDRGITREEFRQAALYRFQLLDPQRSGRLTLAALETLRSALLAAGPRKRDGEVLDSRIANPLPPGN
jgi:Ca2+-binding EF-hand superfamily protein